MRAFLFFLLTAHQAKHQTIHALADICEEVYILDNKCDRNSCDTDDDAFRNDDAFHFSFDETFHNCNVVCESTGGRVCSLPSSIPTARLSVLETLAGNQRFPMKL